MERLLILNPGSTSTKIAVFDGEEPAFTESIVHTPEELAPFEHVADQYEFRRDLVAALSPSDVEGLTRRQFQAAFPGRAFTWRGPGVLSRNFALQQKRENR